MSLITIIINILKATNASDLIDWLIENNLQVPEEAKEAIKKYVNQDNCYFVINKIDLKNRFKDVLEQLENGTYHEDYYEYIRVLTDLRLGLATPLKFEFTPPFPYYPLVISSLNAGYGKIEVYVISEKPVADKNMVLKFDKCKIISNQLREKLASFISIEKAQYVTRLSYYGELSELTDDAVFEFFSEFDTSKPSFSYVSSGLDNLSGSSLIEIMTFDPNDGILELRYRIDNSGPWMIAERASIFFPYPYYPIYFDPVSGEFKYYERIIHPIDFIEWKINLDTSNLNDGEHQLDFELLRKDNSTVSISNSISVTFNVNNSGVQYNTKNSESKQDASSLFLSGLVVLSIAAVAIISRKTKLPQ